MHEEKIEKKLLSFVTLLQQNEMKEN